MIEINIPDNREDYALSEDREYQDHKDKTSGMPELRARCQHGISVFEPCEECTEKIESAPCNYCGVVQCRCDAIYDDWQDRQMYKEEDRWEK